MRNGNGVLPRKPYRKNYVADQILRRRADLQPVSFTKASTWRGQDTHRCPALLRFIRMALKGYLHSTEINPTVNKRPLVKIAERYGIKPRQLFSML